MLLEIVVGVRIEYVVGVRREYVVGVRKEYVVSESKFVSDALSAKSLSYALKNVLNLVLCLLEHC